MYKTKEEKEEKPKEIGEEYKIIYSGYTNTWNGVGVIVDKETK